MSEEKPRIIEGWAMCFNKVDRQGDLITPEALKNADLQKLRGSLVDLRFNRSEPVGTVMEVEKRDEGVYARIRIARGVVLPLDIGDCRVTTKGVIRKARIEEDVTVVEEAELTGISIIGKEEVV